MTLAVLALASCPMWAPGDSEPVTLPAGCALGAVGVWRTVEAERDVELAVAELRRCAAAESRAALVLRATPEPPSRLAWALAGASAAALMFLTVESIR